MNRPYDCVNYDIIHIMYDVLDLVQHLPHYAIEHCASVDQSERHSLELVTSVGHSKSCEFLGVFLNLDLPVPYLGEELVAAQICNDFFGILHRLCVKLVHKIHFSELYTESVGTIFLLNHNDW